MNIKLENKNNLPIDIIFKKIMNIYKQIMVLSYKPNLWLFIISMSLCFFVLCLTIGAMLNICAFFTVANNFSQFILLIVAILQIIIIFLRESKSKKEIEQSTGLKIKKITSYELFYSKCHDVPTYELRACVNYCKFLLTKKHSSRLNITLSYPAGFLLPIIANLITSSIITAQSIIDLEILIQSLLWGLIGIMTVNTMEKFYNMDYYFLTYFMYHTEFVLLNRELVKT